MARDLQVGQKGEDDIRCQVLDVKLIDGPSAGARHKLQQQLQRVPVGCGRMSADVPFGRQVWHEESGNQGEQRG
jgi:hypothetical protein